MLRKLPLLLFLCVQMGFLTAQTALWSDVAETAVVQTGERRIIPAVYRTVQLDLPVLQTVLQTAPERFTPAVAEQEILLQIPRPDGGLSTFRLYDSPVMAPGLQERYPEIRTCTGIGIDDPGAVLKCDFTPWGFHAMVRSKSHGDYFIDPYSHGNTGFYVVYNKKDFQAQPNDALACLTEPEPGEKIYKNENAAEAVSDCKLRTYRLALACTGEYAAFHGGTVPLVLAAMVTSVNRVNGVYENDLAVTMVMVPNNDLLVYLNSGTDPYTNGNGSTMLSENVSTCNSVIGLANYDIGHVFSTGGGGIAGIRVVCTSNKARGVTGSGAPVGDPFDIDYVAHEMGHQFGANHTQNNACNSVASASMEPGSASTIMGYAGICAPDVQSNSDDYFHAISLQEIGAFITTGSGNNCPVKTVTGNNAPTVSAGADYVIPKSTPFALTATGMDVDSDSLSYCWEQMDPEFATMPPVSTSSTGPMFRSYKAVPDPTRYFPRLPDLLANINSTWEELPAVSRNMKFRVTVRDNFSGGGCTDEDDMVVTVAGNAGPFLVTAPNNAVTWLVGDTKTVTWNVANTNASPVNCSNVDILLSTDGGYTYPVVLASNVPNNGSAAMVVPNNPSTTCRVKVAAAGNVFYDISNQNFTIELPFAPTFVLNLNTGPLTLCAGETATFNLNTTALVGFADPVTITVANTPPGATIDISPSVITPSGAVTVTISGLNSGMAGYYPLEFQAVSTTVTRTTTSLLTLLPGAPTADITAIAPAAGATGVSTSAPLNWHKTLFAEVYTVEVSTNPAFSPGSLVFTYNGADTAAIAAGLGQGQVYYWRAKASSQCGEGAYFSFGAFQTGVPSCGSVFNSSNVPKAIGPTPNNIVNSTINILNPLYVADVNVTFAATHTWVGDLSARLISPSGTTVELFDQPGLPGSQFGCSGDNMAVTLNNTATLTAAALESACNSTPPAISGAYQPSGNLAGMNGEPAQGAWTLQIIDNYPSEDDGNLTAWSLEFCFLTATPVGTLLTNNVLNVPTAGAGVVDNTHLQAVLGAGPGQGVFTLLSATQHGTLLLNGQPLAFGDTFTQADIDGGALAYQNNGDGILSDGFNFSFIDQSTGAWYAGGAFAINILQNTLAVSATASQAVSCFDSATGQMTAAVSGGYAPFTYTLNTGAAQSSEVFDNLPAGVYTVVITDVYGFTAETNTVVLDNPPALTVSAGVVGFNLTATGAGGTGALEYSVDGVNFQPGNEFNDLPNGFYIVTVKDANGCTATTEAIVAVGVLLATADASQQVGCAGGTDGEITVNAAGGIAPLEFSLDGVNFQSGNIFSGLPAGTYTATVQDALGATITANTVTLTDPPVLTAGASVNLNVITASAAGGTGAHAYSLDGVNFQPDNIFGNLANGVYVVTVQDAHGCTATTTATVDVAPLEISDIVVTNILCAGGTATLTIFAANGIPPYQYNLNGGAYQSGNVFDNVPAGTHTLGVIDAAGTTISYTVVTIEPAPLQIDITITGNDITGITLSGGSQPYNYTWSAGIPSDGMNLPNGAYSITITDANGCTTVETFTIDYTPVTAVTQALDPLCHGDLDGEVIVNAANGTPPYEYSMNGVDFQSSSTFTGLGAGTYNFVVRDALGDVFTVNAVLNNPPQIVGTANVNGSTITIPASGGTGVLQFSIDNVNYQPSPVFANVPDGTYTVRIEDENGCILVIENVVVDAVGTNNLAEAWGLRIMPNPSSGRFLVALSQAPAAEVRAEVLDAAGRLLLQENWGANGGAFSRSIDLSQFPQGGYTLRLSDGRFSVCVKLSVQR